MKRRFYSIALLFTLSLPIAAQAQFSMPKLPTMGRGASGADLSGSQDKLVIQYVSANRDVLTGDSTIAGAVGLKDKASSLKALADATEAGSTADSLKQSDSASSAASQDIAARLKTNPTLDASAKAQYALGLSELAGGLVKYVGLKGPAASFSKGLTSSPAMVTKLQSGAYIVRSLPGNLSTLGSSLSNAVAFAKSHDITVPADATSALSALGG